MSLAEALLSQHVDCVTRAGSPGTESRSRARSLVLLTMSLAPVVENATARLGDQLQLDNEANCTSNPNAKLPTEWLVRSRQSAYSDGEDEVASRSSGILNPRPTEVLVQAGGHPGVAQQGVTLTITLAPSPGPNPNPSPNPTLTLVLCSALTSGGGP